jgi:hypothetical protein
VHDYENNHNHPSMHHPSRSRNYSKNPRNKVVMIVCLVRVHISLMFTLLATYNTSPRCV